MIVSSPLFDAYLECDTKCWLRSRAEPGTGNIYAEWVRLKNGTYCEEGRKRLLAMFPENGCAIAPRLSQHDTSHPVASESTSASNASNSLWFSVILFVNWKR